ncbi:hypothetical protein PHYC_01891 [Phycisphaerales bacterium]|nr:hypothetical protein PHYC_01891 [Phycisphaerales bacterium]
MTQATHTLRLTLLPGEYSVARLRPSDPLAEWMTAGSLWCVARSPAELSVVAERSRVPDGVRAEHQWRVIRFEGPLPFGLTGILASVADPLAAAGIPIFAFSTFDTDYVMIGESNMERATAALRAAGHHVLVSE